MKKCILIFILIIFTFSSASCKGTKNEIESLAVVLASGFDLTPEGKYLYTSQILNAQKESSSNANAENNGDKTIPSDVVVFSAIGDSPIDAINHLSVTLGKKVYFGHSKYVVLGKDLAQSGLSLFVDNIFRRFDVRPDKPLFITKGKASEIIAAKTIGERIPANSIENLAKIQSIRGYASVVSRLDFANALSSKTAAPVLGVIELNRSNHMDNTFLMEGTAVFKKDKLIGFMDINETRGMEWIKGKVKDGNITIPLNDYGMVTFDILTSKSEIKPLIEDGILTMQITIKEIGNIGEMSDTMDPMKNFEVMNELGKLQDKAIEKEVELALNAAQNKFRLDIFDFGEIVHKADPDFWKKNKDNWGNLFPDLKINVKVNSSLKRPGIISKPIK